jgi:hypothetical protein
MHAVLPKKEKTGEASTAAFTSVPEKQIGMFQSDQGACARVPVASINDTYSLLVFGVC